MSEQPVKPWETRPIPYTQDDSGAWDSYRKSVQLEAARAFYEAVMGDCISRKILCLSDADQIIDRLIKYGEMLKPEGRGK